VAIRGWREGEMEHCCLIGLEYFSFARRKKFWRWEWYWFHHIANVLSLPDAYFTIFKMVKFMLCKCYNNVHNNLRQ
jgi:hypothetical protein